MLCFGKIVSCFANTVLCFDDVVLCFDNTVLCFDNTVLCFDNNVLCFDNNVLCFDNSFLCSDNTVLWLEKCLLCFKNFFFVFADMGHRTIPLSLNSHVPARTPLIIKLILSRDVSLGCLWSYRYQNHCLNDHLQITPSIAILVEKGSRCSKIICYNCVHKIACYIFGVLQNVFLQLISYSSDVS